MNSRLLFIAALNLFHLVTFSQDTSLYKVPKYLQLSEVVIRSKLDVPTFIKQVQLDTSFYKAFKNLRVLNYSSLNDIRMMDKKGRVEASMNSKTRQHVVGPCRITEVLDEKTTGSFYKKNAEYKYYTAELYSSLFFAPDTICGENNIVGRESFDVKNNSGIEKHKEQLKMLFFDPGKKVPGVPFMGKKTAIFDEKMQDYYDYEIDMEDYEGESCYIFVVKSKALLSDKKDGHVVLDKMTTWFSQKTMEIVARNYSLSYKAGLYRFDVSMEVKLSRYMDYLVPTVLRYDGEWNIVFKKKEKGIFTATLFDFSK